MIPWGTPADAGAYRGRRSHRLLAVAMAASVIAGGARADVFEVGTGGSVTLRGGGGVVVWSPSGAGIDEASGGDDLSPDVPAGALTLSAMPQVPVTFQPQLAAAATRYDISPTLLAALVWQESRWQPAALSRKGAMGLAQLMPATARALAVDPRDTGANLAGAAHYLRQLLDLFDGDVERALAAYNAGPARVIRAGGVPPIAETRAYVTAIMDRLAVTRAAPLTGAQP